MTTAVTTPEAKQNFDWIYVQENPTGYKTEILDGRSYICDNNTRKEFDRLILPKVDKLVAQRGSDGGKIRITDLGCCFGNTMLALVNGMTTDQIRENWKDAKACEKINVKRRLPCMTTGIDISENALKYGKRAGIMDETIAGNLNTEAGLAKAKLAIRGSDILISTATLVYLNIESVDFLIEQFAAGMGEGYMICNFLNPFELEKTDQMKQILLKHLDFVGSTASQHRTLSPKEAGNYPDYGEWALLEIWTLKRRGAGQRMSPPLKFSPAPRADIEALPELSVEEPKAVSGGLERRRSLSYKDLVKDTTASVKQVLLVAAAQLSSLDSLSGPKCLIRLGEYPIICHVISQLCHAGVERAVVLCGYKGERIEEIVKRDLDKDVKSKIKIEYVHAGEAWHRGSAYSLLEAAHCFSKDEQFLVCMADHIFDPAIIANMTAVSFSSSDQAFALVETDFKDMVGASATSVKVQLVDNDKTGLTVTAIGRNIDEKDAKAVDAGLFACDTTLFKKLEELSSAQAYFTLADAMNVYATQGSLKAVKTEGKMWFAVETKEALDFAVSDGLKQMGTDDENWLSDGAYDQDGNRIPIVISGKGNEMKPGGSKWETFAVERWRSAVYINLSFFEQLCKDTDQFIIDIAKNMKLRGHRVTLVEVGCGTGEFIRPLCDHFRLAIGLDFNQNFINFCNENIPKGKEEKCQFITGDACQLIDVLKEKAPKHIWSDTKIVSCVGNTIGIIPENMKQRVYEQMAELAGDDGVVVIVYWNARCFGDACQNFYHANPQLCGPFAGDSIDFNTTTLTTPAPTNYRSHWTGIEEARNIIRNLDMEEILVEEKGRGVLVAARKKAKA